MKYGFHVRKVHFIHTSFFEHQFDTVKGDGFLQKYLRTYVRYNGINNDINPNIPI